jgi:hypothetical protein
MPSTRLEYCFVDFYSRGDNLYLHRWAAQIDRRAEQRQEVITSTRKLGDPHEGQEN